MDSSQQALQTNEKLFSNFKLVFLILTKKKMKNIQTNKEVWILIKLQCFIYQWITLNKLYQLIEKSFSNFNFVSKLLAENRKIFKPCEYWYKCKCIMYQWIWLDKLFKLFKSLESFFQISESFFKLVTIFLSNSGVRFMHARRGTHLCWTVRVLVSIYAAWFPIRWYLHLSCFAFFSQVVHLLKHHCLEY